MIEAVVKSHPVDAVRFEYTIELEADFEFAVDKFGSDDSLVAIVDRAGLRAQVENPTGRLPRSDEHGNVQNAPNGPPGGLVDGNDDHAVGDVLVAERRCRVIWNLAKNENYQERF